LRYIPSALQISQRNPDHQMSSYQNSPEVHIEAEEYLPDNMHLYNEYDDLPQV
jgi:hypothetical protein